MLTEHRLSQTIIDCCANLIKRVYIIEQQIQKIPNTFVPEGIAPFLILGIYDINPSFGRSRRGLTLR